MTNFGGKRIAGGEIKAQKFFFAAWRRRGATDSGCAAGGDGCAAGGRLMFVGD